MNENDIIILPEIEDLLYPLKNEELTNLEASLMRDGVREPLCVWKRDNEKILIDGHHRYAISKRNNLPYQVVEMSFGSLDEVLDWVDRNQIGRRNMTEEERATTLGRIYQRIRDARAHARVNTEAKGVKGKSAKEGKTADKLAQEWNVGSATVKRASAFSEMIGQLKDLGEDGRTAATKILNGEVKDALTELPKVAKNPDQQLMQQISKAVAGGADKIKDVIKASKQKLRNSLIRAIHLRQKTWGFLMNPSMKLLGRRESQTNLQNSFQKLISAYPRPPKLRP